MAKHVMCCIAVLLCAFSVSAECFVDLVATPVAGAPDYKITWNDVPGATEYEVERSSNDMDVFERDTRGYGTGKPGFTERHIVSEPTEYFIRVTALNPRDPSFVPCSSDAVRLVYTPYPAFRKIVRKANLPLVGSTPGAYGARFKTSLRLRADSAQPGFPLTGKLVFRPAGVPASDSDPSIPYRFESRHEVLVFDDIVAAFGATGIGSIDIIPDENRAAVLPIVETRLFNENEDGGTFGTFAVPVLPFDFISSSISSPSIKFVAPEKNQRVNVGVRTFAAAQIEMSVRRAGELIASKYMTAPPDLLIFGPAKDLLGVELEHGDLVQIVVLGIGVPLYTFTDNRTNDPALFTPPRRLPEGVLRYELPRGFRGDF